MMEDRIKKLEEDIVWLKFAVTVMCVIIGVLAILD